MLLLSSVGIAEAKQQNPHSYATLTPTATFDGAAYDLGFDAEWDAYRIGRIFYRWWSWDGSSWVLWDNALIYFTLSKPTRSANDSYTDPIGHPQDVGYGERWRITAELQKPKGNSWETLVSFDEELVWS